MKSKELLLGMFAGLLLCLVPAANAQTNGGQNVSDLQEVGPDNIGGRVSCLLLDGETLYAGASLGGVFKKTASNMFEAWQPVPCRLADGTLLTLPVSTMAKTSNGNIYIGTGEKGYVVGNDTSYMAARGRGLWKLVDGTYTQMIDPATNDDFSFVNELVVYEQGTTHRQFAATEGGLYTTNDDWATYTQIYDGPVCDIELVYTRKMLFFGVPGGIYRISNVESEASLASPVCITTNEPLFATAGGNVKIAVSPTNPTFFYAMVFEEDGTFDGIYLSRDQQSWMQINTSSVAPFSTLSNGNNCGALTVSPTDARTIYIGGENIWTGHCYADGQLFQWTTNSVSEHTLNMGDYMSSVYNNARAVHSGVKQILNEGDVFYMATNGGVFRSANSLMSFDNISYGLNTVPVVDFAVCPDGSIIMGADQLASPFLASRSGSDDAQVNHSANIIFTDNGGQPAASRFQRIEPSSQRGIFVSANGMQFGRSYKDYSDYTQTQTWTTGKEFLSSTNVMYSGYDIPRMILWETDNNTVIPDSITLTIDTLGVVIRDGHEIRLNIKDSMNASGEVINQTFNTLPFTIQAGDKMRFSHPGVYGYPFEYTFTEDFVLTDSNMHIRIQSPLHNRLYLTAKHKEGENVYSDINMNWTPSDFRKVYTLDEMMQGNYDAVMMWTHVVSVSANNGHNIYHMALAPDGNTLYAGVWSTNDEAAYILRVRGLNSIKMDSISMAVDHYFNYLSSRCRTTRDTLKYNGTAFFKRPISSMTVDPRAGKDCLIVTFGDGDNSEPNIVVFDNASTDAFTAAAKPLADPQMPAYSSMVEYTTGEVYVGTEDGVFVASAESFAGTPSWQTYGEFKGVPVTSMHQQIDTLKSVGLVTHNGINAEYNVYSKTKFPYAMYFGTYGRGIFIDMKYVTDRGNSVVDSSLLAVPTVLAPGKTSIAVYPNPATSFANIDLNLGERGNTVVRVYDMSGKMVDEQNLGLLDEGSHQRRLDCQKLNKGVYIVNVVSGRATSTTKLVVR